MRDTLRWISIGLFVALGIFLVMFGVLYASVRDFLPFHAAAAPSPALEGMRPLYLALMKLIGGASAALGLLGLYVTVGPMRRGSSMAAIAVAGTFSSAFMTAAYVAETLAEATHAPTSWHIMGILLALTAAALIAHFAASSMRKMSSTNPL
jgi:hypothetical protein